MEAPTLLQLTYIFVGGGSGSLFRYLLGHVATRLAGQPTAWGTWLINILGSLLIGYLLGRNTLHPAGASTVRHLLIIGFCGGFTTFSSFSAEALGLLRSGQTFQALTYLFLSLLAGLLAVYLGGKIAGA